MEIRVALLAGLFISEESDRREKTSLVLAGHSDTRVHCV